MHIHVLHALPMVRLGPLRSHVLKAMDGLEIHGTDVRRALITDAPALTFQELFHGRFWEFAPGHQGPLPFGELPGHRRCSAAVRCVCGCLSTIDARGFLRRGG